jgi:hypothetical protein
MGRPLLFLDVDGVLNACPPLDGVPVFNAKGFPICVPPGTKERIARLLEAFDPVWATTWRGDAHAHFCEAIGVDEDPPWDHIDSPRGGAWKLPEILQYAWTLRMSGPDVHQPWVWIDDDGRWEMQQHGLWHDKVQTLVICPDTAKGLTDEHVEEALAFAERLKEHDPYS